VCLAACWSSASCREGDSGSIGQDLALPAGSDLRCGALMAGAGHDGVSSH
jgi:hypothetical protein